MSAIEKRLYKPELAIKDPLKFETTPTASFWIGRVAIGELTEDAEADKAASLLRAKVYVEEKHFLEPDALQDDGTERDSDDLRSSRFVILANPNSKSVEPSAVATARLIHKGFEHQVLPSEKLYPDVFKDNPAPVGAVEVSRFIARYPSDRELQHRLAFANLRTLVHEMNERRIANAYAIVEKGLATLLRYNGVPLSRLSDYRPLEEFNNTETAVITFEPRSVVSALSNGKARSQDIRDMFSSLALNGSTGYFDEALIKPVA